MTGPPTDASPERRGLRRQVSASRLGIAYLVGAWLLLAIWGLRLGRRNRWSGS